MNHKQETSTVLDNGEEEEMGSDLQNYCQYLKLCKVRGNSEDLGEKNSNEGNRNIGKWDRIFSFLKFFFGMLLPTLFENSPVSACY